jgi:hypothetical protein
MLRGLTADSSNFKRISRPQARAYDPRQSGLEFEAEFLHLFCIDTQSCDFLLPCQATAYKVGMTRILELRALAQAELSDRFDIRDFHDVVLTNGSMPLNMLEELLI